MVTCMHLHRYYFGLNYLWSMEYGHMYTYALLHFQHAYQNKDEFIDNCRHLKPEGRTMRHTRPEMQYFARSIVYAYIAPSGTASRQTRRSSSTASSTT